MIELFIDSISGSGVESLDISDNALQITRHDTRLQEMLFLGLKHLTKLDISKNKLLHLELSQNETLRDFNISHCSIATVPLNMPRMLPNLQRFVGVLVCPMPEFH